MNKLNVTTSGDNEIHMVRTFDAPRRLVVEAMTTPELIKRWLGNSRSPMIACELDARVGGKYRYVFRRPDGIEFTFTGVHREVSDDKIVFTQVFNGDDANAALITATFVEQGSKTTMRLVMHFDQKVVRDAVVATGLETGAAESYDNLEALVASS